MNEEEKMKFLMERDNKCQILEQRIKNAIEYVEHCQLGVDAMDRPYMLLDQDEGKDLLEILKGRNDNE